MSTTTVIDPDTLAKIIHEDEECVVSAVEQLKHFDNIKMIDNRIQTINVALADLQAERDQSVARMNEASDRAKAAIQRAIDTFLAQQPSQP